VRNPLYLGTFLIGAGFCAIIWHPFIFLIFVIGFFVLYGITVKGEEQRLSFKFPNEFKDYAKSVPRFLSRLTPYPKRSKARFAIHRILGHGELITLFAILALFFLLYVRHEFFQERNDLNLVNGFAILGSIIFGATAVFLVSFRYRRKKYKKINR
jgi:hypothetical protein